MNKKNNRERRFPVELFKEFKDPVDKCVLFMAFYLWFIFIAIMAVAFMKGARMDIDFIADTLAFPYP